MEAIVMSVAALIAFVLTIQTVQDYRATDTARVPFVKYTILD